MKYDKLATYALTALDWSKRSTCVRKQVGAVIFDLDSDRLLAIGYNGTASGLVHCNELFYTDLTPKCSLLNYLKATDTKNNIHHMFNIHHRFSELYEVHAEQNALLNMIHTGTKKVSNMGIMCTLEPCINCAKLIVGAGIKHVWYIEKYDRATYDIKQYFKRAGVTCEEFVWQ